MKNFREYNNDMCRVCGQTPCNCTTISEQRHRVAVTVSEPDHPAVTMRRVQKQRFAKVTASSKEEAVKKAQAFYKKAGYKVHSAEYHSELKEEVDQIDELKISTLTRYGTKATQSLGRDASKTDKRIDGINRARAKVQQKESVKKEEAELEEAIDKNNPIVKEYDSLKKNHDIKSLRNLIKTQHKIIDTSEFKTKDHAISHYLRAKHGNKKVADAFGLKEEVELEEMTQGKEYTKAQIQKKIQSGQWEAQTDVKPGKHVEMRHHTGKKVTVYVKEDTVAEGENKQIKGGDPCWKGYQMVGMKNKDGKKVPNCVPANEGTGSLKPGWMLKQDPKLAAKVKAKTDLAKKRQASYGNPAAGKTVKESLKADIKAFRSMMEEASFKVDVEGLPTMYVKSSSPAEVKTNLRKILKKADMIRSVDRIPDGEVKKAFRLKAQGKDTSEE